MIARHVWKRMSIASVLALVLAGPIYAQLDQIPQKLKSFTEDELVPIGRAEAVVSAVNEQNALNLAQSEIRSRDARWKQESGVNEFMFSLMTNRAAFRLLNVETRNGFIVESFVTDNQGALVSLTEVTSDYWQGDEAKFTEAYDGGEGSIRYGPIEFDGSAGEIVTQISVPVMSGGSAVGVAVFSISLDRWERR